MSRFFGRGRSFHGRRRGFLRADLVFRIMRGLGFWDTIAGYGFFCYSVCKKGKLREIE